MKVWIFAVTFLAVGCKGKEVGPSQEQEETGEPVDTNHEETGAADDTAAAPACTPADLTFAVELRGADGAPATTFTTRDTPTAAAVVTNTCDGDVRVETSTTCLVTKWTITGTAGTPIEIVPVCNPVATSWTVPALGMQETTGTIAALSTDTYTLDALFGYQDTTASTTFTVQ